MGSSVLLALLLLFSTLGGPDGGLSEIAVCPRLAAKGVHCHAVVQTDATGTARPSSKPKGLGPRDLVAAYRLPAATGRPLVAVVDAYDNPSAESDLRRYRAAQHLPPCPSACVRKVDQHGGNSFPLFDEGWALESALDLQAITAVCPACDLLLVEATSASFGDLLAAEDRAVALGAHVISNSWGGSEDSSALSFDPHFSKPGVMITVSSGDNGYGVEYPASSRYVTAVGGTTLRRSNSSRGWSESAWSGSGSGCSAYESQPAWQTSNPTIVKVCAKRAVADVSAVADPKTGFGVYDSSGYGGQRGWFVLGGTSLSAPIIAGVYALAGNAASLEAASHAYANKQYLNPVRSGSNGTCGNAMCHAGRKWGGPSGLGTPKGTGAF